MCPAGLCTTPEAWERYCWVVLVHIAGKLITMLKKFKNYRKETVVRVQRNLVGAYSLLRTCMCAQYIQVEMGQVHDLQTEKGVGK